MSETWKRWEGQEVGNDYRLQKFLGSTDHSAVYQAAHPERPIVAVKLVPAALPGAAAQLALWEGARKLEHLNLLKLYACGRCRLGEQEMIYAVLEYAEENLGQVLPLRALTVEETRQVLEVALPVLGYLHERGLVYGHLKPANIMAQGEVLKLSSDTIGPSAEKRCLGRTLTPYDAPETFAGPMGPASDAWSLGVTLLEACTQQPAVLPSGELRDPDIPPGLSEPFLTIVRHALRREPAKRWSCEQIAERLNPGSSGTQVASQGSVRGAAAPPTPSEPVRPAVPPLSVPLSPEPAIPLKKLPKAKQVESARRERPGATYARRNFVLPLMVALLILVGLILLPKILHHSAPPPVSENSPPASTSPQAGPSAGKSEAGLPGRPSEPERTRNSARQVASEGAAPAGPARKVLAESSGRGEVLESVLPQASSKALATITGTVHVVVRAKVDASGKVSEATLEAAGPSNYFARLALEAARRWQFASPVVQGRSLPSEWLLRFEFSSTGVQAFPTEVGP